MAKKRYRKKNNGNLWVLLILALLVIFMGVRTMDLRQKEADLLASEAQLSSQIAAEQERTEELENYSKWKQTLMYIEQVAREKLGLVFPDEIILKPEN